MRQVFVVGDSISIQYGPHLERFLAGRLRYARKEGLEEALTDLDYPAGANGGDSSMVLAYLRARLGEPGFRPDALVLNCGLHDLRSDPDTGAKQVPLPAYRENLLAIRAAVEASAATGVWVRTTPVVDAIHNARQAAFHRHQADVEVYNAAADAVFADWRRVDLHDLTAGFGEAALVDHAHFSDEVQRVQAAYLAGHLLAWFG